MSSKSESANIGGFSMEERLGLGPGLGPGPESWTATWASSATCDMTEALAVGRPAWIVKCPNSRVSLCKGSIHARKLGAVQQEDGGRSLAQTDKAGAEIMVLGWRFT